jgi:hypothetical protein
MTELLAMADRREHRQDRLNYHPDIPRATFEGLHIGRIPGFGVKTAVGQDHHLVLKLADQAMERCIGGIRRGILPGHNQPILIEDVGNHCPNDLAMVRHSLATNLAIRPVFAPRMPQLDAIAIGDAQDGWLGQEQLRPISVGLTQLKQARPLG